MFNSRKHSQFVWYRKRLKAMSFRELGYRISGLVKKKMDQYFKSGYFPKGEILNSTEAILFSIQNTPITDSITYAIFGTLLKVNEPIDWHKDIINNKVFPFEPSFSIDTRTAKYGNVKVVWEVNRLQFLPLICLRYKQSKDVTDLKLFIDHIQSWKTQNPYMVGVNWYSNIEVNIRLINWFFCWEILEVPRLIKTHEIFADFVERTWLPLIELHATHSFRYDSKYSSANNHLIAEASGMFIAGSYWKFKNASKWVKKGKDILEREIQRQHSPNGINKEEASEYIQFITDFFLIACVVGERTGEEFSENYKLTLKNILYYISHLMDISGNIPYYGDDDDGKVTGLNLDNTTNNFHSLLTSGAILFKESFFKSKVELFDFKNQLLFGKEGKEVLRGILKSERCSESKLYRDEGHFILKNVTGKNETYLHVDMAPLGYLSIAAHGHADALSFFLNIDGTPYISDTGTYTYHSSPNWRQYFKGTLAHNTIRVDGLDQATYGGPSLWLDHFEVRLLEATEDKESIRIKGSHNGYEKIGITHIRSYDYNKLDELITIKDEIISKDNAVHTYELPLHLHPEVGVFQLSNNQFELSYPGKRIVSVSTDEQLTPILVNGSKDPILGWYSPSFLQKQPTTVIYSKFIMSGSFKLQTIIEIKSNTRPLHEA